MTQNYMPQPSGYQPNLPPQARPPSSNGFALAALLVGIGAFLVGLVPIFGAMVGITGIVFGAVALNRKQSKGMAVTGIILAGLASLSSLGITAVLSSMTSEISKETTIIEEVPKEAEAPAEKPSPEESELEERPEEEIEPAYDGTQFAKEIEQKWKSSWGLSDSDSWSIINEDESFQTLMGHISHLESPQEGIISAILAIPANDANRDEANDLARNQLPMMINDDRVKLLQFVSEDGQIVGSSSPSAQRQATDQGLTPVAAQVACDGIAKREFPYGVKMHWIKGK